MSRTTLRTFHWTCVVIGAALILADPPPQWVAGGLLFALGLDSLRRIRRADAKKREAA